MDITVDQSDPCNAQVSTRISASEFRSEFNHGLRTAGGSMKMKGFRPGKVPLKVLEQQFGEQMRHDVMQTFLNKAYQQAVEENELKPMASPRIVSKEPEPNDQGDYSIDFTVPLKPQFEVRDYKGMEIESEIAPVLPELVQAELENVRNSESLPEPAGEEGIDEKGVILCDVNFLHEGESVLERKGLRLAAHTPPPGLDPEAYTKALTGAKDGDVIEMEMTLPADLENEAACAQPGTCRFEVSQAFRMVPPADEDLCKKYEVEDIPGLETKIREHMEKGAQANEDARQESALLDRVIQQVDMALPDTIIDEQTEQRLHQMEHELKEQGMDPEQINAQLAEQGGTARDEAERGLKALLIVEAVGTQEELLVNAEDIQTELGAIAERNQVPLEEVRKYYAENNLAQQMTVEILERKVRKFLRENAEVTTPS